MKIKIGTTYRITNKYKKSYVEREFFTHPDKDGYIAYETGWRSGTWEITPQNKDEVDMIKAAMEDDYEDTLEPLNFDVAEMIECFDGCWDDITFEIEDMSEEEQERIEELIQEEGYYDALTSEGYDQSDSEFWFQGAITVEVVTNDA